MAAAAAPRRRLTTRERRGVVRHRDGSVPPEAGHFFFSDSDIDGDGASGALGFRHQRHNSAIGRRGREGEWAASTSVSYMWRRTGHSERRELAKNWSTNKVMRRFWKEMARPAGLEPATLCLEVRLASSTVFHQLLPLVALTQLQGVCFRSQRLRLALLMGEFSDSFLTVVAATVMLYGLCSTLLQ